MAIFIIIIVALLTGLTYAVLFLLTKFIQAFRTTNFTADKKLKLTLFIASIVVAAITAYFFLFTSSATNNSTAYIEKDQQGYKVTIKGKRLYMFHDPMSLFLRKTYEDSAEFKIPRDSGVIDGLEVPNNPGSYKVVKGNAITIKNDKMVVSLFYYNYDNKKLEPSAWNGDYKLQWRN